MKSHIKHIGIELEGAYNRFTFDISQGWKYDGSVNNIEKKYYKCLKKCKCDCSNCQSHNNCCQRTKYNHVGEVASKPLKIIDLLKWTDKNYPDYTNRSCGMHLHFSFNSITDYSRLMERRFYYHFLDKLEQFGRDNKLNKDGIFWERIKGKNDYCKKEFIPELQASFKKKDGNTRYRIVNCCFQLYGTYEVRVLPCFAKKIISLKAIKFVYDVIENYLIEKHTPIKDKLITVKLQDVERFKNLKKRLIQVEEKRIYIRETQSRNRRNR